MALNTGFDKAFRTKYQDIRAKTMVADKVTSFRLESNLTMGKTVSRFKLDLSGVRVRTETRYSDRTLDAIHDSEELITVDQEKYMGFPLHKNDILQNGPMKVGMEAGKQIAIKAKSWADAFIFSKVTGAFATFEASDIGGSAGQGVDLTVADNVNKMITLAPAKIRNNMVDVSGNLVWVIDPYAAAYIQQMLIGKNIDLAGSTFKNGYAGPMNRGEVYISDNLTFEAQIDLATNPTNNDTLTIGGVSIKFVSSLGATPGNVLIGGSAAATLANVIALINGTAGAGTTYVELSTANRIKFTDVLRITASNPSASILNIVCIGAGKIAVSDTLTAAVDWINTRLHGYVGRRGQIDVVMQREVNLDKRPEPKQPVDNYFVDFLMGAKVFDDAKQNFLDLWIKS